MPLDVVRTRHHLKDFNFKNLFIEELGWNHCSNQIHVTLDGSTFSLSAVAEKHGMVAFTCSPSTGERIPDYSLRRKIERQTAKSVHEHIIIYTDFDRTTQIWQWVKRETGKPTACREHTYHINQPGDSLIQKLQAIVFRLEEEEILTIVEVAGRAKAAFDIERITKRFYDRFKTEHDAFLKFIDGIPDDELQRWYASVMLNRLMFICFIQSKGFLNNDTKYLKNKLAEIRQTGKNKFYKEFLCPLFFEGFAKKAISRSPEINKLLGEIPYLNGGLFLKHQIEELHGRHIEIADNAFEKLFDFFDQFQWHLDERPLRKDNEINPDVLGYIFEKYINQKQMGAYYTKEDITGYISKNTVIPFLFDTAKQKCKIAFEGEQVVWRLLQADSDKYFYPAVKKGIELPLPDEIAAGIADVSKRTEWNRPAPSEYALPTEIWREVVARRQRYEDIKSKMLNGEVQSINDLITYNLDIRQFAQDVIWNSEGPELLRAFYHAIENVTVLDPTCGSGAFLFAALNILEPLYEACLDRMQVFLEELERSDEKHRADKYGDFRKILKRVSEHPNLKYFIFKSIIVNNLYGVDIMEEAIEICKLRLFLKLVAQIDSVERIEPLPDIDFNIRAGNTLVGFATYDELKQALQSDLVSLQSLPVIEEKAEDVDRLFKLFHQQQTELGGEVTGGDKQELRKQLKVLEDQLNSHLANEYGVDPKKKTSYEKWLKSHQPFHWFIEFYGILKNGGFDVIIGNPPYVVYSSDLDYKIKGFLTENCSDLYAFVIERSLRVLRKGGHCGLITPISLVSTDGFLSLRKLIFDSCAENWFSTYAMRPSKLFDGADKHLCIWLAKITQGQNGAPQIYATKYYRWADDEREHLFNIMQYVLVPEQLLYFGSIPKIGTICEIEIYKKILNQKKSLGEQRDQYGKYFLCHTRKLRYFVQFLDRPPKIVEESGKLRITSELKEIHFSDNLDRDAALAAYCSTLFFWFFLGLADCRNVNKREVDAFQLNLKLMHSSIRSELSSLANTLMKDLQANSEMRQMNYKKYGLLNVQVFAPRLSKPIIDRIDRVLAKHYGFSDEELDFVINYDIKYRMGRDGEE